MSESSGVGLRRTLQNGYANSGNDKHGKKRELKTWSEERVRIENQQSKGGCTQSIQHGTLAIQQTHAQVQHHHERRPPDRCANIRKQCIRDGKQHGKYAGGGLAQADAL